MAEAPTKCRRFSIKFTPNQPHRRPQILRPLHPLPTTHHRAYYRALKQLVTLQESRAQIPIKPVILYPKPTAEQILVTDPPPAESITVPGGAGSPDPRRAPSSGSIEPETSRPQSRVGQTPQSRGSVVIEIFENSRANPRESDQTTPLPKNQSVAPAPTSFRKLVAQAAGLLSRDSSRLCPLPHVVSHKRARPPLHVKPFRSPLRFISQKLGIDKPPPPQNRAREQVDSWLPSWLRRELTLPGLRYC